MSAPRTKRQFAGDSASPAQRTITSYFTSSGAAESTPSSSDTLPASSSPASTGYPVLPAAVQTNLLNVGMRVRKSVPEGYKTGNEPYGTFKLWTNTPTTHITTAQPIDLPKAMGRPNELLPFCGIHKVGGLAPQVGGSGNDEIPALDDVPQLSHSHESMSSDLGDDSWGGRASKKRFISDEEEEEVRRGLTDETLMDAHLGAPANRTIALPRRKKAEPIQAFNIRFKGGNSGGNDFEDAEFLHVDALDGELKP